MMRNVKNRSLLRRKLCRAALVAATWAVSWPGAAQRQIVVEIKEPEGVQEAEECVKCHQKVTPNLVAAFQASTMARAGIQNPGIYEEVKKQRAPKEKTEKRKAFIVRNGQITCVLCHGDNHTTITQTRGRVANAVCGGCHVAIDQEYEKGGGHTFDNPEEYWKISLAAPEFLAIPSAVLQLSRDVIYGQQGATAPPYFDPDAEFERTGRIHRNGCVSCHTRHRFDVEEARKPESCQTCHSAAGISVSNAYLQSKHGSILQSRGKPLELEAAHARSADQGRVWLADLRHMPHAASRALRPGEDHPQYDGEEYLGSRAAADAGGGRAGHRSRL